MVSTGTRGFVRRCRDGVVLGLRVSPGAKRTALKGFYGEDAAKLAVSAPPVDGKANAEAERFLAGILGVAPSGVSVVCGASSRDKSAFVRGVEADEVFDRLGPLP